MSAHDLTLILHLILAVLYLPLLFTIIQRHEGRETTAMLLGGYALIGALLNVAEGLWRSGRFSIASQQVANDLQTYGALLLAFFLTLTIVSFLRRNLRAWLGIGAFWAAGFVLIMLNVFGFSDVIWTNGRYSLTLERLAPAWAMLGWLLFMLGSVLSVRTAYARSRQPLLRNRLNYWTPVFLLIAINDVLLLSGYPLPGNPIRLAAVALATFIVVTHDPPDLVEVSRRVVTYIITTLVIVGFYVAGFTASQTVFRALPNYSPLLVGAGIALLLSFIFTPLLSLVRRWVNRWLNIQEFHPSRTLHAYSEQISNILDMQRLANVAVGLIIEAMDISRGFLFLVDSELTSDAQKAYRLRAVRNQGERQVKIITLTSDHPVVKHFMPEQRPLLQYDLDLLPAYRSVSSHEREWFNHLEAEVYLPIFSKREWIGMLALGAKISGKRYTENDLVTLSALANQTAVALENARLVENLVQLNTELRQAYRALDKANRDLERLDQTKSDFISIASHELRTPLTTIIGYTEMLIEDQTLPPAVHTMLKSISKGTRRLHEIMDSMFDIAQIDTRTLHLHLTPVDTAGLIKEVSNGLENSFKERKQTLSIDIPSIPLAKADPNLLKKLFQHLLTNAIKYTPNDGKITVAGRVLPTHSSELPHGGVEIIVSDTGVGVDPASQDIIFSKFYQPGDLSKHSTSKTRFKGSGAGLGLALSKGIVEAHGGRIWVESKGYDEVNFPGSKFHVVLPLSNSSRNEEAELGEEVKVSVG
ncbi:MAG TPA: GAF domain-containing sensor histidine kinase [Anaerolineales bacterium]|nr:GAF domain-containing sensor histidine kinase [Anaerolineales bacterium]